MSLIIKLIYNVYPHRNFNLLLNKLIVLLLIIAHLINSNNKIYALNEQECPPLENNVKLRRYQRFVLPFTNAKFRITPALSIPVTLTDSVSSSINFALPISFTFKSKLDIVKDLLNQYLNTNNLVTGLQSSLTAISAAITSIIGVIPTSLPVPAVASSDASSDATSNASSNASFVDKFSNSSISDKFHLLKNQTLTNIGNIIANISKLQSRSRLYKTVEASHSRLGKYCLLRAICEISQTPLLTSNSGLIGEIIDMLLSVDSDLVMSTQSNDFDDYLMAQSIGKNSFVKQSHQKLNDYKFTDECSFNYAVKCPFSLFNILHIRPLK